MSLLLLIFLIHAATCQSKSRVLTRVAWSQCSVSTVSQTVATQTNISWAFATPQTYKKNDCIVLEFPNPFSDGTYKTFGQVGVTPCTLNQLQKAVCQIESPQKFKITFMDDVNSQLIKGQTTQAPFQTPLSARRMQSVTVSLFSGCNQSQPATVTGRSSNQIEFQPKELKPSQVQITSSSQVVGATDNTLTLTLQPSQNLPKAGKIIIKAPQWYMLASVKQGYPQDQMSPDSMFDLDSLSSLVSGGEGLMLTNSTFSMTSGTISIAYENGQDNWSSNITVKVSKFKNPINNHRKTGFQIQLTDAMSVLCATTGQNNIELQTLMVTQKPLAGVVMQFLGDEDGNHVAQVGFKNSIYLQMTSPIPLEPMCVVKIQLPKQLKIEEITKITGDGFFKSEGGQLTPNLYTLDRKLNTLTIQACLLPNTMTSSPSGSLTISSVQLPSYQQQTDPIQIQIFSNNFMTDVVVDNPNGPQLQAEEITPGKIKMVSFQPSDPRAFAQGVNYQMSVTLQSGFLSSQRMTVKLPKGLKFSNDCQVALRPGLCKIDNITNTVVLTNMTSIDQQPDSIVTFTMYNGHNPNRSQQAGEWDVMTEILIEGKWYVQDAGTFPFSFKSLAGKLDSELIIDTKQTYSLNSTYTFSSTAQHEIPKSGFLHVQLPQDCAFGDKVSVYGLTAFSQNKTSIILSIPDGAQKETRLNYSISGIRNPRSFAPSDPFIISTLDSEQYVIDQGLDVNVQMEQMNYFDSITFKPLNPTNGFVGTYLVQFKSHVEIKNGDMLYFTLPSEMRAVAGDVSCTPDNQTQRNNVVNVTCQSTGQEVLVNYDLIRSSLGNFGILLNGIKNPPSFRKSTPITNVALKTKDNWPIQQARETNTVQTTIAANITNYTQDQNSEQYGEDSSLTLSFRPLNPFTTSTLITINWPASAVVYSDTECQITTSKVQTSGNACVIDIKNSTITIRDIFDQAYSGTIKVNLSKVRNPLTNKNLKPWLLQTFDDGRYPSDILMFHSLTECNYPCHYCGTDKNYCTECWPGDTNTMLMKTGLTSTCQPRCNSGWTSNGNKNETGKLCVRCDASCAGCYDRGNVGDYKICSKCTEGFNYFEPATRACMKQCAIGQYDLGELLLGNKQCGTCNSDCLSCEGIADNCTACKQNSNKSGLFQSKCLEKCPYGYGNKGGVCVPCKSPCKTCSWDSDVCTSCDNSLNRTFIFGRQCVETCPEGTLSNDSAKTCIGCNTGCNRCNDTDQSQCIECDKALYSLNGTCLNQCPAGFASEFEDKVCLALESLDIKLVYFPFILLMVVIMGISCVGKWVKPKHKILANFVVMMGFLEHIALITQVALCFAYGGTIAFAIVSIFIWLMYLSGQFVFQHFFSLQITQDKLLQDWMNNTRNQVAQKIFKVLGYITWKCYKLLYSHYFGYQVKTTDFSNPEKFQKLMLKMTIANILTVYCPLIALNIYGLLTSVWGTQLYVMFAENIILGAVMIAITIYEETSLPGYMDGEHTRRANYNMHMQPVMAFQEFQEEVTKEQQQLLKNVVKRHFFTQMKFEELIELFGERKCRSVMFDRQNEGDPRKVRSYPMSPGLSSKAKVKVADPPIPIWPIMPNNCIGIAMDGLVSLNGNGRNKGCQAGSFGNDLKRNDADLVSTNLLQVSTVEFSSNTKKQRGRKNRFNLGIDQEDYLLAMRAEEQYGQSVQDQPVFSHELTDDVRKEIDQKIQGERLLAALEAMRAEDEAFHKEFRMKFQLSEQEVARQSGLELNTDRNEQQEYSPDIAPGRITEMIKILPKESEACDKVIPQKIYPVEVVVPNSKQRTFNENEILGEILRDVNGLKIIDFTPNGSFIDLDGRPVTKEGYLLNREGQVVSNVDQTTVMFSDLVDGELPAPHCFEKFNFSPWEMIGEFDYSNSTDPQSFFKTKAGELLDLKDRKINLQGFLISEQGDLVKYNGERVLHKSQLEGGLMPPLYNYDGVCFNILDVMGVLEVFEGRCLFQKSQGTFKDKTGHLVNDNGYLITKQGHICSRNGQVLFQREHLKFGDFPKIFAFSDFDKRKFQGSLKQPVKDPQGNLKDLENKLVNKSGYLVDQSGNVIDRGGNVFLDHSLLDSQGELPLVFLIVQNDKEEAGVVENIQADQDHVEDTSYGSEMAQPIKFEQQNQDGLLDELLGEQSARRRRRKHKSKDGMVKLKQYFEADIKMAEAYGGVAKPRERLVPERVAQQRFATVARERPRQQPPKIQNLTQSVQQQEKPQTTKNIESKRTGQFSSTDEAVDASTGQARQRGLKLNRVQPSHFKDVAKTIFKDRAMTINPDYCESRNRSNRKNDYEGVQYDSPSSQLSLSSGPQTTADADPAKTRLQYFTKVGKQKTRM